MDDPRGRIDRDGLGAAKPVLPSKLPMEGRVERDPLRILIGPLDYLGLRPEVEPEDVLLQHHVLQIVLHDDCELDVLELDVEGAGFADDLVDIAVVAEQVVHVHQRDLRVDAEADHFGLLGHQQGRQTGGLEVHFFEAVIVG